MLRPRLSRSVSNMLAALMLTLALTPAGMSQATVDLRADSQPVDLAAIKTPAQVIERLSLLLSERYVFPEKAEECVARLASELAQGTFDDYSDISTLGPRLTMILQDVTGDKHLRVHPRSPGPVAPASEPTDEQEAALRARMLEQGRRNNFGFEQVFRVEENVGVLDLRGFSATEFAQHTAVGAMQFLGSCDALVFDLRQNGGGDPEMVQLLQSYLFDEPTHLNSLYWREGDQTQEFWTHDVPGNVMGDVPVIVLTSRYTFSAAEEFTYNLKCRDRATIVGETTGGGAHPGGDFPLSERLGVFISMGRAINPITGTNWEGTGVVPHVEATSEAAFDVGLELAMKQAREYRKQRSEAVKGA